MSLLSERAITVPAHACPTDTKRSHRSARSRWVTFWVTQKSHRAKTLSAERVTVRVRFLPATHCVVDQHVIGGVTSPPSRRHIDPMRRRFPKRMRCKIDLNEQRLIG